MTSSTPILRPSHNVWQTARADRVSVIVDAADYFTAAREAMLLAQCRIMLIGWDFDTRIKLSRNRRPRGEPATLGEFILWLADTRPDLEIKIIKWDVGALKMLFRGSSLVTAARWAMHERIQFKLDGAHPVGASHHQKIVVVDDCFAVCGGIDMTSDRWDTPEHIDDDPRRKRPGGKLYGPWHDVTMLVDGGVARALGELGRMRWVAAGGEPHDECTIRDDIWPKSVEPMFRNVEVGIARTRGEYQDSPEVREIETLFDDLIAGAKHFIYIENQYFASRRVAEAIATRMAEPDPPEVILVTAANADGWLEQQAMDTARARLVDAIQRVDHRSHFRIYHSVTAAGEPIYVHAKLMIVDDQILRVGSANMNNRSLGLDSECDLVLDDTHGYPEGVNATISALRMRLMAEHLGVDVARIASLAVAGESTIAIIEALRGNARSLVPFELPELTVTQSFVADNEVLDPEAAGALFEPFAKRRLFRRKRLQKPTTA